MKNNKLFLDIHTIQTLPPSNINRDDTGSPKTAIYGGVTRARVSSQSWKRAIREYFNSRTPNSVGIRSLNLISYVADEALKLDDSIPYLELIERSTKVFEQVGMKSKDGKLKVLLFLGENQAKQLAELVIAEDYDKNKIKEIVKNDNPVDIALFGRMVADDSSLTVEAATQVAHAISTHSTQTEYDFFTAVDDLSHESQGAGMLGTIEFNSSTMYRYSNVAVHDLLSKVNEDKELVKDSLRLYIDAFVNSLPGGKVTSFAHQTLPQLVVVSLRKDRPLNLISAYENAIKSKTGYARESILRLDKEIENVSRFAEKPLFTTYIALSDELVKDVKNFGVESKLLSELLDNVCEKLEELV